MSPDQLWLDYCKDYGMDPHNLHMKSVFMAGVVAEREACDDELAKVYHKFVLDRDYEAADIVEMCSEAVLSRRTYENQY